MVRQADADAHLEQFTPDPLCSPQSIVPGHFLDQGYDLCGDLGCDRWSSGPAFPKELEALAMPAQQCLWLNDDKGLFPGPRHSCQQYQEHPIRFGTGRPFHLSPQYDQLLTQECVFCDKFGLATGLVGQRPQHMRCGVRSGPDDEVVMEGVKTKVCHACDERENPLHCRRSPL
jgi:hypothetical protein